MATGYLMVVVVPSWVVAGFRVAAGLQAQAIPGFWTVSGYRVVALVGAILPCRFPCVRVGGVVEFSSVGWPRRCSR